MSLIETEFHSLGPHFCITCLMYASYSISAGEETVKKAKFLTLDSSCWTRTWSFCPSVLPLPMWWSTNMGIWPVACHSKNNFYCISQYSLQTRADLWSLCHFVPPWSATFQAHTWWIAPHLICFTTSIIYSSMTSLKEWTFGASMAFCAYSNSHNAMW